MTAETSAEPTATVATDVATIAAHRSGASAAGSSRLAAPAPRPRLASQPRAQRLISRPALMQRLLDATEPVILLQAPAGYGKTVLLEQWAELDNRRFARISMDLGGNDLLVFIARLLVALDVDLTERESLLGAAVGDAAFLHVVTRRRVTELWANRQAPLVLVIDDMHHLEDTDVARLLADLAENSPPHSHVVLCGRAEMPVPLARWLVTEQAVWLRREDLAMTADEEAAVLTVHGVRLEEDERAALGERLQGWPAGTFLAGKWLSEEGEAPAALAGFSGCAAPVARYLREEVLAPLPPYLVSFLERCSPLALLRADICDALLGGRASGQHLGELVRLGIAQAAEATDDSPGGFSCHPLLRDLLRADLHAHDPAFEREVHQRAAEWLRQEGQDLEAIAHAVNAGDYRLAADLMWDWGPPALTQGQRRLVESTLQQFPEHELLASPKLALTLAWCALQSGRSAVPWVSAAEQLLATSEPNADDVSLHVALRLLKATLTVTSDQEMLAESAWAYENALSQTAWRSLACFLYGTALHFSGNLDRADEVLEEGQRLSQLMSEPTMHAQCTGRQALVALDRGDWELSQLFADRALDIVVRQGFSDLATMVPVYLAAALNRAHERRTEEALQLARHASRLLTYVAPRIGWLCVEGHALLGRMYLLAGDSAAARVALAEAEGALGSRFEAPVFHRYLKDAESIAAASPLNASFGPSTITTAELRVLHMLPTHLSFDEIGRALFLSRNTVKTQAISVYRKLGVRSRSEAVANARKLGLLNRP